MKQQRCTGRHWLVVMMIVFVTCATQAWAATEQVIHDFGSPSSDGSQPVFGLIRDAAGNLYEVTSVGGDFNAGTVFELSPLPGGGWKYSVLHSFGSGPNDGGNPQGRLAFDSAGNLYGATLSGGTKGVGVVFQLSPTPSGTWNEIVIHSFTGGPAGSTDGGFPEGGVIVDAAGNVFGTTDEGGSAGVGVVYQLSPSPSGWIESFPHQFLQRADGGNPIGDLTVARRGRLYGVTFIGSNIFRLTQNPTTKKWNFKTLFTFQNNKANGAPNPDLAIDAHFHTFGTMSHGAPNAVGTVFELSLSAGVWTLNYLYGFSGGADGGFPNVGVVMDTGILYGTTPLGGTNNLGVVYQLTPSSGGRSQSVLHSFASAPAEGAKPILVVPVLDQAHNLYGTTWQGGSNGGVGSGMVWQLTP